jgi:hypothetical protein
VEWKRSIANWNVHEFIQGFTNILSGHVTNYDLMEEFNDIEDELYTAYYVLWTQKFNTQFSTNYP